MDKKINPRQFEWDLGSNLPLRTILPFYYGQALTTTGTDFLLKSKIRLSDIFMPIVNNSRSPKLFFILRQYYTYYSVYQVDYKVTIVNQSEEPVNVYTYYCNEDVNLPSYPYEGLPGAISRTLTHAGGSKTQTVVQGSVNINQLKKKLGTSSYQTFSQSSPATQYALNVIIATVNGNAFALAANIIFELKYHVTWNSPKLDSFTSSTTT